MVFGIRWSGVPHRPSGRLAPPPGCNEDEADAWHINAADRASCNRPGACAHGPVEYFG
ncbi:hypothetical protein BURCENBC7_AP1727 [Burkholderia cenocepacia BC7]|jgi:hypothetical protein|nr:hypothetical protein BURCENK562V_C0783 [Burkholderia cenocepacia K56-2Valvano]ERI29225.1 hypothetical protein BURCENBC7_AP1727 [Burkholderia cenocepacia BC7]